ncbi:hypothetical protein [Tsukamurella paurometabola]|uniref:Uncharacterized protein n=1 Tax=Tsukamurella paurometabola TaxID=2061 RepID=A0ABS5NJ91_TSUPA|nr:hypothetical protein [Tsukamurella paurometabola]MBS4104340.1 hypothetical protein [Tsukamurella paurometabola]
MIERWSSGWRSFVALCVALACSVLIVKHTLVGWVDLPRYGLETVVVVFAALLADEGMRAVLWLQSRPRRWVVRGFVGAVTAVVSDWITWGIALAAAVLLLADLPLAWVPRILCIALTTIVTIVFVELQLRLRAKVFGTAS